ncbi:MAG: ABC transporter ATP-binding protein [Candidatus Hydrogenedentota bacterium]
MASIAIKTVDLGKKYRSHFGLSRPPTLDGLDLEIREGEVFGFLGKNGAGKTTTIKILCGLIRQTKGEAYIFDRNVREKESRKFAGFLPESPYFYEYLTPRETLEFYGELDGLSVGERKKRWDYLSETLNLRDIADDRVQGFSKGMRQRLGFAVAMAGDPKLLILDEPMSGLDPMGRHMIRDLIQHLREERKTIFFSSHILGDVEQVCDRVGMLINGKLHREGSLSDLLTRETSRVDVVAKDVRESLFEELGRVAHQIRTNDDGHCFSFRNHDEANDAARLIVEQRGTLLEMNPIKESLEEYFVRQQGDAQ